MNASEDDLFKTTRRLIRDLHEMSVVTAPRSLAPAVLMRIGLADGYFEATSAIGRILVAFNQRGISAVDLATNAAAFEQTYRERAGQPAFAVEEPPPVLAAAITRLLAGEKAGDIEFDLSGLSQFEKTVLSKALQIPRGEVRPYAWVAAEIGRPGAVRAVGSVLGRNPVPLLIPCHRVVRSDGQTGDYVFGGEAKRALLRAEGAQPEQLERLAQAGIRFYGSNTTRIFCYPTCRYARRISEAHRVGFRSGADAAAAGYRPCKTCRPV
jgi:O-6-methylguanine DNA methyltransferase